MPNLSWTPEWSPNWCIQALLVARKGEVTFRLKQDGAGYWGLSAAKDIPYDVEAMAAQQRAWIEAEAAWACGKAYDTPSLEPIKTEAFVGCESPPNFGRGWNAARATTWANSAYPQLLEASDGAS